MALIELAGEDGNKTRIMLDLEAESAIEAKWDALFENSQDLLEQMAQAAHEEYLAGLTEDL
jgi:hypothetical protein